MRLRIITRNMARPKPATKRERERERETEREREREREREQSQRLSYLSRIRIRGCHFALNTYVDECEGYENCISCSLSMKGKDDATPIAVRVRLVSPGEKKNLVTRCNAVRCKLEKKYKKIKIKNLKKNAKVTKAIASDKRTGLETAFCAAHIPNWNITRGIAYLNARYMALCLPATAVKIPSFASYAGPLINAVCIIRRRARSRRLRATLPTKAYVTRRASSGPRDSRSRDGERQAEAVPGVRRRGGRGIARC